MISPPDGGGGGDSLGDASASRSAHSEVLAPHALPCEMCANYETKLQQLQDVERLVRQQLAAAQHLADRYQTELSGERLYRSELEQKMARLSGETEYELKTAAASFANLETRLKHAFEKGESERKQRRQELDELRRVIEGLEETVVGLTAKYDNLRGVHRQCAEEMRAEAIALPDSVSDLQFMCLQLREELIETRAAKEHDHARSEDELAIAIEHGKRMEAENVALEMRLTEEEENARREREVANSKLHELRDAESRLDRSEKRLSEMRSSMDELETRVGDLQKERTHLESTNRELLQRVAVLQQELGTSETVQKDFVKLSQSLQIQLEKIRQAEQACEMIHDHEVRWQWDEDVTQCNECSQPFNRQRVRQHCLHCGRIFCPSCLSLTVPSGPQHRPARVCQLCHTLLSRHSAPYFAHVGSDHHT